MKKYIFLIFLVCLFGVVYVFRYQLYEIYAQFSKENEQEIILEEENTFSRKENFLFVQYKNHLQPKSKEDLYSIYYTILDAGVNTFHFYCPKEYKTCIQDVKDLANDQTTLSHINNFVHPFNGFKHIETEYDNYGKVTLRIQHTYTKKQQTLLLNKKEEIEKEIWKNSMTTQEKIQAAHNYIINHTEYDKDRSDSKILNYQSDTAYGALIQNHALCGGYTDSMILFLEDLGLENYKISSENHVWNAVKLENKWYHLDLT